jgi:hypothetical protein
MSRIQAAKGLLADLIKGGLPALLPLVDSQYLALVTGLTAAYGFYSQGEQRNFEAFCRGLGKQVSELSLEVDELKKRFEQHSCFIVEVINLALREKHEERMAFYASVVAERIENISEEEADQELKLEFVKVVSNLSNFELILLEAMARRQRGEVWDIPTRRGSGFLVAGVQITPNTLSWIDLLIQKGLVSDVSVEKIQQGIGMGPPQGKVNGRSSIRISDFGRNVIAYMLAFKEN